MISIAQVVALLPYSDFSVRLMRDQADILRVAGELHPPSTTQIPPAYRIMSHGCGDLGRAGAFRFRLDGYLMNNMRNAVAWIDVSDMVVGTHSANLRHTLMGICIGFNAQISRNTESLIYRNTRWMESLILSPAAPSVYAVDGSISYATFHNGQFVYVLTGFDLMSNPLVEDEFLPMTVNINDPHLSTVSHEAFDFIIECIELNGGTVQVREASFVINATDCYDTFTSIFPNLHYTIANEAHGPPVTDLVFTPPDYIERTLDPDICNLMVTRVRPAHGPLRLTDHLTRKIGGIHFMYHENRIGFFDPI